MTQPLTRREQEVLDLVRQGMRNRDMARELGLKESTVKAHMSSIFTKLEVSNRTEAAIFGFRPLSEAS